MKKLERSHKDSKRSTCRCCCKLLKRQKRLGNQMKVEILTTTTRIEILFTFGISHHACPGCEMKETASVSVHDHQKLFRSRTFHISLSCNQNLRRTSSEEKKLAKFVAFQVFVMT